MALLRAEKEQAGEPAADGARATGQRGPEPAENLCPACQHTVAAEDRFCSRCGAALSLPPESEASA